MEHEGAEAEHQAVNRAESRSAAAATILQDQLMLQEKPSATRPRTPPGLSSFTMAVNIAAKSVNSTVILAILRR